MIRKQGSRRQKVNGGSIQPLEAAFHIGRDIHQCFMLNHTGFLAGNVNRKANSKITVGRKRAL